MTSIRKRLELASALTQIKIDRMTGEGWTFADIAPDKLDVCGPHSRPSTLPLVPIPVKTTATEVRLKGRSPTRKLTNQKQERICGLEIGRAHVLTPVTSRSRM